MNPMSTVPTVIDPSKCLPTGVEYCQGRGDYPATHGGEQAPAFDVSRPVARFNVPDNLLDAAGNYSYQYIGRDGQGNPAMLSAEISGKWAKFNLPGVQSVQKYSDWLAARPAVTSTYNLLGGPSGTMLTKEAVYTKAEADALAADISAGLGIPCSAVALKSPDGNALIQFVYTDDREEYDIQIGPDANSPRFAMGNNSLNAAEDGLFQARNRSGIGWPGSWTWPNRAGGGAPVFTPQQFVDYGTLSTTHELPLPCVLPAGAMLVGTLMGIEIQIPATDAPASGGLTGAQATQLSETYRLLVLLSAKAGVK